MAIHILSKQIKKLDKTHLTMFESIIDSHVYDWYATTTQTIVIVRVAMITTNAAPHTANKILNIQ